MQGITHPVLPVLLAEDDPNDVLLVTRALKKLEIGNPIQVCRDGQEAIEYLQAVNRFSDRSKFPFPNFIITDLKMPRKSGFEILQWLKEHPECHVIPILVLSASNQEQDVKKAYQLGANCFLRKPNSFGDLLHLLRVTFEFWNLCEKPAVPQKC